MSSDIFDISELDEYSRRILELATKDMPKETKKFMRTEGKKLRKATVKKARTKTKKRTGNYYKGIKAGKVYKYSGNGGTSIMVRGGKPAYHAHLLEYGHRQVSKSGEEVGFVQGLSVFEDSRREFSTTFYEDVEKFIEEMTDEL